MPSDTLSSSASRDHAQNTGAPSGAVARRVTETRSRWTAEARATLVRMADEGATAHEIGDALGTTRNAVLGYCFRQSIKLPWTPRKLSSVDAARRAAARGQRGKKAPSHPMFASRPFGTRAFPEAQIAVALAAVYAGLSHAKAAKLIGASAQSVAKNWLRNPTLAAMGRALYEQAKADAAIRAAEARRIADAEAAAEAQRVWLNNVPLLAKMPARHRAMLQRRLDGQTLQEVGDHYGVTRERIRQIEVRWRMEGLIIPGARPLNEDAAARMLNRTFKPLHKPLPRPELLTCTEIDAAYWSEKVERAFATVQ